MPTTNDLTTGRVCTRLLGFFFPMLLANTLQQAYAFADAVIVGKGLGDGALGAVGNLSSLMLLVTGFLMGMTGGFSVVIARSFGSGDSGALRNSIARSAGLCGAVTAVLTLGSLLLRPLLFSMNTAPELLGDSLLYGYIFFGGLPLAAAYSLYASVLRALGDSRTPLLAVVISSVVNIALDCLLIFVLHSGVEGAALATAAAQGISALVCYRRLRRQKLYPLFRKNTVKDSSADKALLHNGIPAACMNAVTAAGCMVVQGDINASGAVYTSAYAACGKYLNLFMLPALTAGFALSAFVGQNKGAGDYIRIRQGVRTGAALAIFCGIAVGGAAVFMPERLAALMLGETETIFAAAGYLRLCGGALTLLNLLFIFRCAVQGMGHPLVPMCSGIAEMALRIPVVVLLLPRVGFIAVACAEVIAWLGALLLNLAAYTVLMRKTGTCRSSERSPAP